MKPRQKLVLWVGVLVLGAMGLYPPWACVGPRGVGVPVGYSWLFVPPSVCIAANIDLPRLLIQWAIVGAFVIALYFAWPTTGELQSIVYRVILVLLATFTATVVALLWWWIAVRKTRLPDLQTLTTEARAHPWVTAGILLFGAWFLLSLLRDCWADLVRASRWLCSRIFRKP